MESNKSLHSRINLSWKAFALCLLMLTAAMPTAGAKPNSNSGGVSPKTPVTYEECVAAYQNVKLSGLQKALDKRVDYQVKKLNNLTQKVNASNLSDEQKNTLVQSMANDSAFIAAVPAATKDVTDIKTLKETYCKVRFYGPLRAQQVKAILIVSNYMKRDGNFNERLNKPYNMNYKGVLQDEINQRTNSARELMYANLIAENMDASAYVGASVDASNAANLQKPNTAVLKANFQNAYKAYTESWVLKKAGQGFQKDSTATVVSITLLDDKGKEAVDHLGNVKDAKVVLNVNGKQYTKTLHRGDVNKTWQVTKTTKQ